MRKTTQSTAKRHWGRKAMVFVMKITASSSEVAVVVMTLSAVSLVVELVVELLDGLALLDLIVQIYVGLRIAKLLPSLLQDRLVLS